MKYGKMINFEMSTIVLKDICKEHIIQAQIIYDDCKEEGLTNEQWFLDWQDALNEISVR